MKKTQIPKPTCLSQKHILNRKNMYYLKILNMKIKILPYIIYLYGTIRPLHLPYFD